MAVVRANPDGIFKPDSYSQIATASGSRTVYMSGQVSQDETGKVVGINDLAAQAEQCYRNVVIALKGAGASFADVAKITVFVVNWSPEKMEQFVGGVMRAATELGFDPRTPTTLIGVQALASPELLVEVEAVAVLA